MRRKLRVANRYKGLTLTEVVMASALLLVALVPILKALTIAHTTDTIIEHRRRSLMLAKGKLAEIKARALLNFPAENAFEETGTALDGSYLCNVTDSVPPGWDEHLQFDVAVGYDADGNGTLAAGEVEVQLSTIVTKIYQSP